MLKARGNVTHSQAKWQLEIADGGPSAYRLAQLDDYAALARSRFNWQAGTTLHLRGRVSEPTLPGTWGFGFWNDPFAVSFGLGGMAQRFPALPNCAWFFFSSPENYLSFASTADSKIPRFWPSPQPTPRSGAAGLPPANGFLAQTFSAARLPSGLLALGALAAPLLVVKPLSRWIRAVIGKFIREDAQRLEVDVTQWHAYRLRWEKLRVEFAIDGQTVFETRVSPQGPLGLVIWIDNQFAAWRPDGTIRMGVLPNPKAWLEIEELEVKSEN